MNPIYTRAGLTVFALFLFFFGADISAETETVEKDLQALGGLSGRVVDLDGNGVAGFIFAIESMQLHDGFLTRGSHEQMPHIVTVPPDSDGAFVATNIQPGLVQLSAGPSIPLDKIEIFNDMLNSKTSPPTEEMQHELMHFNWHEPDKRIYAIQVGKVTVFNMGDRAYSEGITFAIKPGVTIENLKITVKPRLRIRGRIMDADGTPLADAQGRLHMDQRHEFRPNHRARVIGTGFFYRCRWVFRPIYGRTRVLHRVCRI